MTVFSVAEVTLQYRRQGEPLTLFRDFRLVCRRGRITSLFGPNGSGKSALLKYVVSFPEPERIASANVVISPDRVGYAPQDGRASLMDWLSGRGNILLPLMLKGRTNRHEHEDVVATVSSLLQLPEKTLVDKPPAMSGGYAQLVVLAREIGRSPHLLVLDEALSNVFYHARLGLIERLREWVYNTQFHILSVSHDAAETVLISDDIVILGGPPHFRTARMEIDHTRSKLDSSRELPNWVLDAASKLRSTTHSLAAVEGQP